MSASSSFVLVTGATGKQGGAVLRTLLASGIPVRALVRDPGSERAAALGDLGAILVRGDLEDVSTLAAALDGARAVFSVQAPDMADLMGDSEVRQGRNLVEAARTAGIEHFVHTSVPGAGTIDVENFDEQRWGVHMGHYWRSKAAVEDIVRAAGFPRGVRHRNGRCRSVRGASAFPRRRNRTGCADAVPLGSRRSGIRPAWCRCPAARPPLLIGCGPGARRLRSQGGRPVRCRRRYGALPLSGPMLRLLFCWPVLWCSSGGLGGLHSWGAVTSRPMPGGRKDTRAEVAVDDIGGLGVASAKVFLRCGQPPRRCGLLGARRAACAQNSGSSARSDLQPSRSPPAVAVVR